MAKDDLHRTRNEFVYLAIRRNLLSGRFRPGERFRLVELCAENDVSMTVLREALTRLTAQGLVKFEANRGYWVPSYTAAEIEDLAMVRINIECLALRRSIERGDVEWAADLVSASYRLSITPQAKLADDPDGNARWAQAHMLYHEALTSACGSARLIADRRRLFDESELMRQMVGSLSDAPRDVESEHAGIAEAALRRDADTACRLMTAHLELTCKQAVGAIEKMNKLGPVEDPT